MFNLRLLEYGKVLELIKEHCVSEYSAAKLTTLEPSTREEAERSFSELRELLFLIESGVPFSIRGVHDTTGSLVRSQVSNEYLDPADILRIRENIVAFATLKKSLSPSSKEVPLLSGRAGEVRTPLGLKERIDGVIDEHAHVREDASARLAEINRGLRKVREDIERVLESYFDSPQAREALQERHITLKDDRYVIPVKHNFKGRIPGIVHAQSGSGETVFVEPFTITSKNNELKLLQKEREQEQIRILISLTSGIGRHQKELIAIQELLAHFDILHAKSEYMRRRSCSIPEFSDRDQLFIREARHPLVHGTVVPIDFSAESGVAGVVITGPNTGGKTVALKTIGLFVLLAQAGFPVPARELRTRWFDSVFADIGDEQSIEQSLSTFSGHVRNIKRIVDEAGERSLVLIDELGAGTDPVEGGALGTAILDHLIGRRVFTVVTTHFSTVKMYALGSDRVRVASVQFDSETCRPTFKLVMGVPGRSNALDIARHLGLRKEILESAQVRVTDRDRSMDRIFQNLGRMEMGLSRKEKSLRGEEKKLGELIARYRKQLGDLAEKERYIRSEYRRDLDRMLSAFASRLEKSIQEIRTEGASRERIRAAREEREKLEKEFEDRTRTAASLEDEERIEMNGESSTTGESPGRGPISVGDSVRVSSDFGGTVQGEVVEKRGGKLIVQAGIFRLTVDESTAVRDTDSSEEPRRDWQYEPSRSRETRYECDIRGKRYQEAMDELSSFLDNAVVQNIEKVYIIHGMGTGALRQGVSDELKKNRHVEHYEYAKPEQGGFGCTIVTLKS
jgi:DNA mismatch repair protein MutS2